MKRLLCLVLALITLCTLCGCGEKPAPAPVKLDCAGLYEQMLALPDMPGMIPVSEKRIRNYYGIDPESCPQLVMAVCEDGLRVDEIWLIEAGSEEAAQQLVKLAESRITQITAETENYLPEQAAVVKAGKVLRSGANVALFISPQAEEMTALYQKALGG